MLGTIIAKRYARALINIAIHKDVVDKIKSELAFALDACQSPVLAKILVHPLVNYPDKEALLHKVLAGQVSTELMRFLETLLRKRRIEYLADIAKIYDVLADEAHGVARVRVTTVFPLTATDENTLIAKLGKMIGKKVVLTLEINRALLGGLTVQSGDTVMDGSVRGRLRNLQEQLLK